MTRLSYAVLACCVVAGLAVAGGIAWVIYEAWRAIFEYYVFGDRDAASSHIPEARRGVLGEMSEEYRRSVKEFLRDQLKR